MWRNSKVFKHVTRWNSAINQLNRFSPYLLRKEYSSSNAGDSDVKAGVPYATLQVGRTQICAHFLLFIRVLLDLTTEYRANFLGIFVGVARWLGIPD